MHAFILERLYPTGWRRCAELYWRFSDAARESQRLIGEHDARGVRVLSVRINPDAVLEQVSNPVEEVCCDE